MLAAPERFACARIALRKPAPPDAAAMFAYASDEDVTRYLAWPRHRSLADTHAFLDLAARAWARDGVGPYVIESRAGELLGSTGIDLRPDQRGVTGYVLARAHWGRGYASEVLAGIVAIARALGLRGLSACVHPDNAASIRVLEKSGFVRVSTCASHAFPNLGHAGEIRVFDYALAL
jgi:ribosomal-protein-alanine N-acetyltransferase